MHAPKGVGAGGPVGLRGQRAAEDGLAHAELAARNQCARQVLRRGGGGFKQDVHALRDDARRILPKRPQGVVQRPPIFLAAAGRVLSEPERQTVNLHVANIRLQRVAADQIRPRHRAE